VAIELAHKYKDNKVLSLATVQRGSIYRLQGKNDEALDDFKLAASIGNSFARQQTITMNPYAALCNQALSEILRKEKVGQSWSLLSFKSNKNLYFSCFLKKFLLKKLLQSLIKWFGIQKHWISIW
jgi:hypothetical protein